MMAAAQCGKMQIFADSAILFHSLAAAQSCS